MRNKKRYAVVIDTYVYADNDYMARKMAHNLKRNINGDHTSVIDIYEQPFAGIKTRELEDLTEPPTSTSKWTDKDPLPF
jgi:hypothetical protein